MRLFHLPSHQGFLSGRLFLGVRLIGSLSPLSQLVLTAVFLFMQSFFCFQSTHPPPFSKGEACLGSMKSQGGTIAKVQPFTGPDKKRELTCPPPSRRARQGVRHGSKERRERVRRGGRRQGGRGRFCRKGSFAPFRWFFWLDVRGMFAVLFPSGYRSLNKKVMPRQKVMRFSLFLVTRASKAKTFPRKRAVHKTEYCRVRT